MNTSRPLSSILRDSRRRPLRSALSALVLVALASAGMLGFPETPPASAQSRSESARRGCETVDLVLLMDRSTSLNNADPGGNQRRDALQSIRSDLSEAAGIRVALIGFNSRLSLHAERFEPATEGGLAHPSDAELEASLQSPSTGGSTDYGVALRGALEVFRGARLGSCRHLVWFTDGIHDTAGPSNEAEVRQADSLRDEVCRVIAPAYADANVSTQVVLLGDSFERHLQSQNSYDQRMAELSAQIVSLITGEREIQGLPVDVGCGTGGLPQDGDILDADEVEDLSTTLIEATFPARGLLRWSDCDTAAGWARTGDRLPAGGYIDEMEVLSYGGTVERYRLGEGEWVATSPGSRRVRLSGSELDRLPPGWVLEVEVAADASKDVSDVRLSCHSKPVDEPLEMEAAVVDEAGGVASVLEQGERYDLAMDTASYQCQAGDFELRIEMLADPRLRSPECSEGDAWFGFDAVPAGENRRVTEASGQLVPEHATTLWPDDPGFDVEVEVRPPPMILSGRPLECVQGDALPRVESGPGTGAQGPRARIVAAMCIVTPQPGGETAVQVESSPDGPAFGMETAGREPVEQPFVPDDGPQEIRIVSEEMASGQLQQTPSTVTVTAELQSSDGRSQFLDSQTLPIGPISPYPLDCLSPGVGAAFDGNSGVVPRVETGSDATSGRLVVDECEVTPPSDGSMTVGVKGLPDGPGYGIVDADGNPIPQPLTLSSHDDPVTILIVTERVPLEELSTAAGAATVIAEWQPTAGPAPPTLHWWMEVPRLDGNRQWLRCGLDSELPRIHAELPLRVLAASCRVQAPSEGSLTVEASAVAGNVAYHVEAGDRGGEAIPWRLASGEDQLEMRVVSEELGPNGWDYEGPVTLTAIVRPEGGVAQVEQYTTPVGPDLLAELLEDLLSCGPLELSNADGDEVPDEPLKATLLCESGLRGPNGRLTLKLDVGPGSLSGGDGSGALDWRFMPASTLLDDGRGLVFDNGEALSEVRLVTSGPLPNDRIEGDGTVMIEAYWLVPGWRAPLTATTTAQYSVDLWPRSILWLAVLITLVAALLSWLLFYGVVAFTNRLPAASNFYARRFEFSTYRDSRGGLRSAEIDSFNLEDHPSIPVNGDSSRKRLRSEALHIDAKHPKWWQIASLLRGGWGEASVGQNRVVAARPAGARGRAGSTPEQFTELAVVALDSRSGAAEPRGVAYVLVPRHSSERSDLRRDLADALADLSGPRDTAARATPKLARSERPR